MLRNIGSNWALAVIQLLVLVQLTRVQIQALGDGANGAWLTIASLTGYVALLVLGVPMATVRFLAGDLARKSTEDANRTIATSLGLAIGLGLAALLVGAGLSLLFEHTYLTLPEWIALGPEHLRQARIACWIAAGQVAFGFIGQLPFAILDAHHAFVSRNAVKIAGLMVRVVCVWGVLPHYPSLVFVAVSTVLLTLSELAVALVLIRRIAPDIRFGLRGFDRARLREILGFSVFTMLLSLGSMLSFRTDQLVIGRFESPEEGTIFDVGNKFFPMLVELLLGIGMVMMPTATKLQATGKLGELRGAFLKWSKIAYSLTLLVGVYLLVLAPELLDWWVGLRFAAPSGRITRVIMLSFLLFLPVRGVAAPMLMGLGKPAWTSLAFVAMGLVNLVLSVVLVRPFGIFGVAVGTAIPCGVFAIAVAWLACREVKLPIADYFGYVIARPTLGVVPSLALLYALKRVGHVFPLGASRWVEFFPLFFSGLATVAVFSVTWLFFVYRNDPYLDTSSIIARIFPRALRRGAD